MGKEDKKDLERCFVAIEFSDEVIKEIARVQELLSKIKFTGKLTELENLHLTLKFLGEIDDDKIKLVKERLGKIEFEKMKLKLGKIGTFSIRGKPKIVWIKIEGKEIHDLQKKIDEKLADLFAPEERFMSHLTIARIKNVKDRKLFLGVLEKIRVPKIEYEIDRFYLMKSELKPEGAEYGFLGSFCLDDLAKIKD